MTNRCGCLCVECFQKMRNHPRRSSGAQLYAVWTTGGRYFYRILAENGVQVVSGMALGIDQAGHKGAMDGGGLTYAVMGCGIDTVIRHPASDRMRASVNKAAYCQNMDRVYRRRHPIFQSGTDHQRTFRPGAGRGSTKEAAPDYGGSGAGTGKRGICAAGTAHRSAQ